MGRDRGFLNILCSWFRFVGGRRQISSNAQINPGNSLSFMTYWIARCRHVAEALNYYVWYERLSD